MTKLQDLVTVVLRHGESTVETRICARSEAQATGEALVAQYQPFLDCEFSIIHPPKQSRKVDAIKIVTPKANTIPHYFKIVA
jgi:hypothetical protein